MLTVRQINMKGNNTISGNPLHAIVLKDSEMLELRGGLGDNITCGSNCGHNCGSNCGNDCGNDCGGGAVIKKGTLDTGNASGSNP